MDIRQLRYFVVLAETLHFSRAAQRLHITQPPLSRQIVALEETVGTPLFDRTSRSVCLTPAGKDFYHHVQRLLADLDLAIHSAQATSRGLRGELHLGFTMYAAWNVLPRLLKSFSETHPGIHLTLSETLSSDLQDALQTGEIDIGLGFPVPIREPLRYQELLREPLCVVLPETHPLAKEAEIQVSELAHDGFVIFPRKTAPALHAAITSCCERAGFEPIIRVETHLQQTIVNLVAADFGVALVPDSMRRMQLPGAIFLPITDKADIEQGIFWNAYNANPCLQKFIASAVATPPFSSS